MRVDWSHLSEKITSASLFFSSFHRRISFSTSSVQKTVSSARAKSDQKKLVQTLQNFSKLCQETFPNLGLVSSASYWLELSMTFREISLVALILTYPLLELVSDLLLPGLRVRHLLLHHLHRLRPLLDRLLEDDVSSGVEIHKCQIRINCPLLTFYTSPRFLFSTSAVKSRLSCCGCKSWVMSSQFSATIIATYHIPSRWGSPFAPRTCWLDLFHIYIFKMFILIMYWNHLFRPCQI